MTDRELLELAAKAVGIEIEGDADKLVVFPGHFSGGFSVFNDRGGSQLWNPLTDDGDAFRLAVQLRLDVLHTREDVEAIAYQHQSDDDTFPFGIELHDADPYAATRRAIVRAAAEIRRKA